MFASQKDSAVSIVIGCLLVLGCGGPSTSSTSGTSTTSSGTSAPPPPPSASNASGDQPSNSDNSQSVSARESLSVRLADDESLQEVRRAAANALAKLAANGAKKEFHLAAYFVKSVALDLGQGEQSISEIEIRSLKPADGELRSENQKVEVRLHTRSVGFNAFGDPSYAPENVTVLESELTSIDTPEAADESGQGRRRYKLSNIQLGLVLAPYSHGHCLLIGDWMSVVGRPIEHFRRPKDVIPLSGVGGDRHDGVSNESLPKHLLLRSPPSKLLEVLIARGEKGAGWVYHNEYGMWSPNFNAFGDELISGGFPEDELRRQGTWTLQADSDPLGRGRQLYKFELADAEKAGRRRRMVGSSLWYKEYFLVIDPSGTCRLLIYDGDELEHVIPMLRADRSRLYDPFERKYFDIVSPAARDEIEALD